MLRINKRNYDCANRCVCHERFARIPTGSRLVSSRRTSSHVSAGRLLAFYGTVFQLGGAVTLKAGFYGNPLSTASLIHVVRHRSPILGSFGRTIMPVIGLRAEFPYIR